MISADSTALSKLAASQRGKIRIDQWLWFARFVKSRSLAARLCAEGAVVLNGSAVRKANQSVRIGDIVIVPQGDWEVTVRVIALGARRGPAPEARGLYEPAATAERRRDFAPGWLPLLGDDEPDPAPRPNHSEL